MVLRTLVLSCMLPAVLVAQEAASQMPRTEFPIATGLNISHWLAQSDKRGADRERYITRTDFERIASLGFDHVRIPVDEVQLWDTVGRKETDAFILLHRAVQWAMASKLRVIVDLHVIRSHYFNAVSNPLWTDRKEQDKLVTMWRELSGELGHYPASWVAYEILNEAVAPDPEEWNALVARVLSAIREKEPARMVVVGSNRWQIPGTFPALKIPDNEHNIILSFHFYSPMALTHHRASWTAIAEYAGPVRYPGLTVDSSRYASLSPSAAQFMRDVANGYFTRDTLEKLIAPAVAVAQEKTLQLYCGEFGVYPTIPDAPKLNWYRDLCSVMRAHHIAFCHWNYKADFPVVNSKGDPDRELVSILTAK